MRGSICETGERAVLTGMEDLRHGYTPTVERQISFDAIRRRGDSGRDFANRDTHSGRLTCEAREP